MKGSRVVGPTGLTLDFGDLRVRLIERAEHLSTAYAGRCHR
ncbi:hypothetical protein [Nonomuraea sp. CA-141351]